MNFFIGNVANFNRKLNLSHLPKTNTYYAHLKAGVKRGRDALVDLRRRGGRSFEGAYLVGNSGKVGQYVKGKSNYVTSREQLKQTPKALVSVVHNHPNNTSLSVEDIFNTKPDRQVEIRPGVKRNLPAQQVVNTTPNGSYYRAYLKSKIPLRNMKTNYNRVFSTVEQEFTTLKPGGLNPKDKERMVFLTSHLANRSLANQGVIHYRAKLTPKDKRTLDFWLQRSPRLRSIYEGN